MFYKIPDANVVREAEARSPRTGCAGKAVALVEGALQRSPQPLQAERSKGKPPIPREPPRP
eukprot:gene24517-35301_t